MRCSSRTKSLTPPPPPARVSRQDCFYKEGNQDIVNWRMLYDIQACGVSLEKGDTVAGPGFKGVFAATSESASAGDTK